MLTLKELCLNIQTNYILTQFKIKDHQNIIKYINDLKIPSELKEELIHKILCIPYMVEILITQSKVNEQDIFKEALFLLKRNGSKSDINSTDKYGNSALIIASTKGFSEIVNFLLKAKADLNHYNDFKITALMRASREGYINIVKRLIQEGADINMQDKDGWTGLMWAACNGHKEIVKLLVDKGVNISKYDDDGNNASDIAKREGFTELSEWLRFN